MEEVVLVKHLGISPFLKIYGEFYYNTSLLFGLINQASALRYNGK
jgi:hypothetical protein